MPVFVTLLDAQSRGDIVAFVILIGPIIVAGIVMGTRIRRRRGRYPEPFGAGSAAPPGWWWDAATGRWQPPTEHRMASSRRRDRP
jgi:hypothetical protein